MLGLSSCNNANDSKYIETFDLKDNTHLRKIGRTSVTDNMVYFAHSLSGVELSIETTEDEFNVEFNIQAIAENEEAQYIQVLFDDKILLDFYQVSNTDTNLIISHKAEPGIHFIKIRKQNEDAFSKMYIKDINFKNCKPVKIKKEKPITIEFFGDSITAAYGNIAQPGTRGFTLKEQQASKGYADIAATQLGFESSLVAFSGQAIALSPFNSEKNMLDLYDTVDGFNKYDMKSNPSDIYVLNLGTNDNTAYNSLNNVQKPKAKEKFVNNYVTLMNNLHDINSNAKIFVCYNMTTSLNMDLVFGLDEVYKVFKEKTPNSVYFKKFETNNSGADGHPGLDGHKKSGDELANYISSVL